MSNRCSPEPTSTLYGQFTTTQIITNTILATSTLQNGDVTSSTSFDVETSIGTQVSPTSTLYSNRCRSDDSQRQTQTQTQSQTDAQTTTQAGGRVIVQTVIRTSTSEGRVVVETQTAVPTGDSIPTTNVSAQKDTKHETNAGAIAGGIVGAVAVLVLLVGLLWFIRKRRRNAASSRNLDEFFADPTSQGWDERNVNGTAAVGEGGIAVASASRSGSILGTIGGTSSKGGTLKSIKRKSLAVLDLEKKNKNNNSESNDTHWAALTRIDSAQLDGDEMIEDERQSNGRPLSRQSLNAIGRPLSFHSMSMGHGLGSPQPFGLPALSPEYDQMEKDANLLRNDSDRSSKSAHSPGELGALQTRSMDLLPSFVSSASPPISPSSAYGSPPPMHELALQEGVAPIGSNGNRPIIARGSQYWINPNGVKNENKPRSWSTSTFNVPERPKSALGLTGQPSPPLNTMFGFGSTLQQSPPLSPTLMPINSASGYTNMQRGQQQQQQQHHQTDLQRGRASINGGTPHYPSMRFAGTMQRISDQKMTQFSPQFSPSSPNSFLPPSNPINPSNQYPPSQYTHLDAHKTEEERAEDRRHALNNAFQKSSRNGVGVGDQIQRRHRSLSGALLLRVVNGEDFTSNGNAPLTPLADEMTPNSSGERSTLSVRNADPSKSQ